MRDIKIGDFVIDIKIPIVRRKVEVIDILYIDDKPKRLYVRFHGVMNIRGTDLMSWEEAEDWELDRLFMREQRLNELGI